MVKIQFRIPEGQVHSGRWIQGSIIATPSIRPDSVAFVTAKKDKGPVVLHDWSGLEEQGRTFVSPGRDKFGEIAYVQLVYDSPFRYAEPALRAYDMTLPGVSRQFRVGLGDPRRAVSAQLYFKPEPEHASTTMSLGERIEHSNPKDVMRRLMHESQFLGLPRVFTLARLAQAEDGSYRALLEHVYETEPRPKFVSDAVIHSLYEGAPGKMVESPDNEQVMYSLKDPEQISPYTSLQMNPAVEALLGSAVDVYETPEERLEELVLQRLGFLDPSKILTPRDMIEQGAFRALLTR